MKTSCASLVCCLAILILTPLAARAAAPTIQTLYASDITTNSATLNGSVSPNGLATTARFEWGTTTNYGNLTSSIFFPAGAPPGFVGASLVGLLRHTNYHFRLVATNSGGVALGSDVEFVTAVPPTITFPSVSKTTSNVVLGAQVNPNGSATVAMFEWGPSSSYGNTTPVQSIGSGTNGVSVQAIVSGLVVGTVYYWRVVATNSEGTTYLGDYPSYTFTLSAAAMAETLPAADVHANSAVLVGRFNTFGLMGSISVAWGHTINYDHNVYLGQNDSPTWEQTALPISGLIPNTVYHYRFSAGNALGGGAGEDVAFTTLAVAPPSVVTTPATNFPAVPPAVQYGYLRGTVNPNEAATTVFFEWGTTPGYGNLLAGPSVPAGNTNIAVQALLSPIAPGTTYHFRIGAGNQAGTNYGSDAFFTSFTGAPTAFTVGANGIGSGTATLVANVNPAGAETSVHFDWGTTTNYGYATTNLILPASRPTTTVAIPVTGLPAGTLIHFRAVATNAVGTNSGADAKFSDAVITITNGTDAELRAAVAGCGTVVFNLDGTITLTNELRIDCNIQIDGSGHGVTLSGGGTKRLFNVVPGGGLSLKHLTLANGRRTGTNGNPAISAFVGGQPGESVQAGGILSSNAALYAEDCTFTNCAAVGGWGGDSSQVGWSRGAAGNARGGCLSAYGSVITLSNCLFALNSASAGLSGYGGFVNSPERDTGIGSGGAIAVSQGALTILACTFSGNGATIEGGAIFDDGATVSAARSRFNSCLTGTASARAIAYGGAISHGGGVLSLADCQLENNFTGGSPGYGINFSVAGQNAYGGGVAVRGGAAVIERSTFRRNTARGGAGASSLTQFGVGSPGEGIGGALFSQAGVVITNTTFTQNDAASGQAYYPASSVGRGGALAITASAAQLSFSTVASNSANSGVGNTGASLGGGCYVNGGTLNLGNSVLSGNTVNGVATNSFGTLTDAGHNLSSDATPVWTSGSSLNNTDPLLLPLTNNGGPTLTMALRAGSPALNTADCASAPATDQRGVARPNGPGCDIGAYEGAGAVALQVWHESATTNVVRHASEVGRAYRLEKTVLFDTWTPVATNIAPAGGWLEFHIPATGSPCFYRVVAQ